MTDTENIDQNRVSLEKDKLELYFTKLENAFKMLKMVYSEKTNDNNFEEKIVLNYVSKLFYTFECLRLKYLYNERTQLKIDTTDSGFVHNYEISNLLANLENRDKILLRLRNQNIIKSEMVDYLFKNAKDSQALLQELSERAYYDKLNHDDLFLPINLGKLERESGNNYTYYWACYDSSNNKAYIYIMYFEEDGLFEDKKKSKKAKAEFLEVINREGKRAPKMNVIASQIDSNLENVHPKVLKRIAIDGFHTNNFSNGLPEYLTSLLTNGDTDEEFVLEIESEYVISKKQVQSTSMFSMDKIREIFFVQENDIELYNRGVSGISRYIILPYKLHQHAADLFNGYTLISVNKQGDIHGI